MSFCDWLSENYTYDALGNLTNKSDTGIYTYAAYRFNGVNRPHAVSNIAGSLNASYSYDPNGCAKTAHRASVWRRTPCGCNVLSDGVRSYAYTSFNLPAQITKGGATTTLLYGPSHERAKETEADGTVSYNFNPRLDSGLHADYRIKANGDKEYVNYLYAGNRPVGTYTTRALANGAAGATELRYFHLDGQGSIIALTNEVGGVVERLSYDAWGKRRNSNGTDDLSNALKSAVTDHGYTGHEHLDDMGLIHMNGRVYDPRTGRFLQADPTIQSPGNLQSFNRYTYVMNNPFFYTDPSGFSWLGDRWHALTGTNWADSRDQYVKPIVAIAISAYVGPWASGLVNGGFLGGVVGGAAAGFVSGGINGGTLNSAMQGAKGGAISGGLFYGAGSLASDGLGNVLTHAAAGCLSAAASQGDCKSSALAAAAGSAWTQTGVKFDSVVANTVMHAVVGGVTAELGGGKFENGAVTGAFGYLFNECAHGGKGCSFWDNVKQNYNDTNDVIPGHFLLPTGAGLATAGITAESTGLITFRQALSFYRTEQFGGALLFAGANSAVNVLTVGSAFQAGVFTGSVINSIPIGGGKTVRDAISNVHW